MGTTSFAGYRLLSYSFGTNVRVQGSIWTVLTHSGVVFPLKTKNIKAEENCSSGGDGISSITAVAEKKQ